MERPITYPNQIPLETDVMNASKGAMVGLAKLANAILGSGTSVSGLACTAGTGLNVSVAAGEIYTLAETDSTAYSSLGIDTHQILKQGISLDPVALACPAPTISGQSINYLVEAKYLDIDINPLVPLYYNTANPNVPFTGMGGDGLSQYLMRSGQCVIQIKAGTAATTGSQTTPSADSGFTALWVVTVDYGNTSITNPIVMASGAPFINSSLLGSAPAFSVSPTMPTPAYTDNSTKGATTAFVQYLINQVTGLIPSLVGYATQAWVNAQDFLTLTVATQNGISADLGLSSSVNFLDGIDINTVKTVGEYFVYNTCSNKPFLNGLMKVWREGATIVYQMAQGAANAGFATRYFNGSWTPWKYYVSASSESEANGVISRIDNLESAIESNTGGGDSDSSITLTTTATVYTHTLPALPVAGFLMATGALNGTGVATYNYNSSLTISGTGLTDKTESDNSKISQTQTMCLACAAGSAPTVTYSASADSAQSASLRLSYLFVPSAV